MCIKNWEALDLRVKTACSRLMSFEKVSLKQLFMQHLIHKQHFHKKRSIHILMIIFFYFKKFSASPITNLFIFHLLMFIQKIERFIMKMNLSNFNIYPCMDR